MKVSNEKDGPLKRVVKSWWKSVKNDIKEGVKEGKQEYAFQVDKAKKRIDEDKRKRERK